MSVCGCSGVRKNEANPFPHFWVLHPPGTDPSTSEDSIWLLGSRHDMVADYLPLEFWNAFDSLDVLIREIAPEEGGNWGPDVQEYVDAGLVSKSSDDKLEKKEWQGWSDSLFSFEKDMLDEYMGCLPEGLDWKHVHPIICLMRLHQFSNMYVQSPYMDHTLMCKAHKRDVKILGMENWQDRFDCKNTFDSMKEQAKAQVGVWELRAVLLELQVCNKNVIKFLAQVDYFLHHDSVVKLMDCQKAYLGQVSKKPYSEYVEKDEKHYIHKRTSLWLPRLISMLEESKGQSKNVMIQVGVDHCVGKTGLPFLLEQKGWSVRKVCVPVKVEPATIYGLQTCKSGA